MPRLGRPCMPCIPDPGHAHDWFIPKMDLKRPFAIAFPFPLEKPAQGHDAPLAQHKITIETTVEYAFTSGINRRKSRGKLDLCPWNKLPPHQVELAISTDNTQNRRILGWAQVVCGLPVQQNCRFPAEITNVKLLVRVCLVSSATHDRTGLYRPQLGESSRIKPALTSREQETHETRNTDKTETSVRTRRSCAHTFT